MSKKSVLLINLGTPDACDVRSVRRYLKEFLLDPRVIDLPFLMRQILVNFFILPLRSKKSAAAYQKIWQSGSPLLNHSQALTKALTLQLGDDYEVELGMRYGKPSIAYALARLKKESLVIVPLFPQYSSAATGSAIQAALNKINPQWNLPALRIVKDFYAQPKFIQAYASLIQKNLADKKWDLILFSYHGLPERHIKKSACYAQCDKVQSCPAMSDGNRHCYRAQCFATTQAIAKELALSSTQYQVAFQSRLGRTPWIKPYTDKLLPTLITQGIRKLAIACPSFVADCLETLEEINLRARADWQKLGGEELIFIPCLNDSPQWVSALAEIVREA